MLRPYQTQLVTDIDAAWSAGSRNVLAVLPTGGGKTVVFTHVMSRESGVCVALAHRQELVAQMSLALARNGLRHRVIAPPQVRGEIEALHMLEFGRRFVDPHSNVICAGVHTIVNHPEPWMQQCALWVCDEGHHLVDGNIWHKAVTMLPNARGLSVTAIPQRADGKGLGRHADGVIDVMIVGPSMRELIEQGYLTEYRIFCPPSDIDLSNVGIGASGDFVNKQLVEAVHKSRVVGDMVDTYVKHAMGKLGLTFTVDVEDAEKTAEAYRKAGVKAEALSAKTPSAWRNKVMRAFRNRELLQIVNCDLLGEGTDVPAVEVVSMGRPTESFQIFGQQFGRMMRPLEGKSHGILFDHVGNVKRHGLPDAFRTWTLDARERSGRNTPRDVIPVTSCFQCSAAYERVYAACPYCGFRNEPLSRSGVQHVDGDLAELDAAALDALRWAVRKAESRFYAPDGLSTMAVMGARKLHHAKQVAAADLKVTLERYGGWRKENGESESVAQRRFYLTFGMDVMTAQTLSVRESEDLKQRIEHMLAGRVVPRAREAESERERVAEIARLFIGAKVSDAAEFGGILLMRFCMLLPPDVETKKHRNGARLIHRGQTPGGFALSDIRQKLLERIDFYVDKPVSVAAVALNIAPVVVSRSLPTGYETERRPHSSGRRNFIVKERPKTSETLGSRIEREVANFVGKPLKTFAEHLGTSSRNNKFKLPAGYALRSVGRGKTRVIFPIDAAVTNT